MWDSVFGIEGPPDLSSGSLVLTLLLTAVAGVAVIALRHIGRRGAGGSPMGETGSRGDRVGEAVAVSLVGLALAAAGLLAWRPRTFGLVAVEGGPVETLSAVLWLACVPLLLHVARDRSRAGERSLVAWTALGAVVCFVLAMEEISWGQRILDFSTPTALSRNWQNEANLHNLSTNRAELVFYTGTMVAFVLLPYAVRALFPQLPSSMRAVLPTTPVVMAYAPAAALNHDMWNLWPIQLGFFLTVFVLVAMAVDAPGGRRGRLLGIAGACVVVQIVSLALGGRTQRLWDVTEYREMFMAAAVVVYAVLLRARSTSRSAEAVSLAGGP